MDYSHEQKYWQHEHQRNGNNQKKTCLRKGKLMRENKILLIAAENNAIRTNHIKAKTHKKQQNSRCRLWGEIDEMINNMIT